ncbi:MAG: MmcQ/YjbR family DNA-binding protein [Alphaproteobacteria bacterium]
MTPRSFHAVVMSFPETVETVSYGNMKVYKAFGTFFTRLRVEDASIVLWVGDFDQREVLLEADPETFHLTEHYRSQPWILARLKRMDAKTLRGYLTQHWRKKAPKKWLKAWDAGQAIAPAAPKGRTKK